MNNLEISQLNQIFYIIEWLFISWITTFVFWIWLRQWFKNRIWDQGWIISKMVGLLIFPYVIWLLSHLSFISLRQESLFIFATVIISLWFIYWYRGKSEQFSWKILKKIVFLEILFLVPLVFTLFYKGFNAQILGTEKLMDVAFINAIARSDNMPPINPWLSSTVINYYYFGQLIVAVWSKISLIPVRLFYNIWIAFIGAISVQIIFLILRSIIKSVRWSVIGAMSIIFAGNIHYAYLVLKQYRAGLAIKDMDYFFANSTRLIGNTINEFPLYSIVLGDLHAHFLDLPLFLLFILVVINLFKRPLFIIKNGLFVKKLSKQKDQLYKQIWQASLKEREGFYKWLLANSGWLILSAWLLGIMYMTNLWDTLTGVLLLSMSLLVAWFRQFIMVDSHQVEVALDSKNLLKKQKQKLIKFWHLLTKDYWLVLAKAQKLLLSWFTPGLVLVIVGAVSLLVVLPFMLKFSAPVGGVGRVAADQVSDLPSWLFYWGGWVGIIMLSVWSFVKTKKKQLLIDKYQVAGLLLIWLIIILLTEIFYVKDVFSWANSDYARTNTVFKVYYQGWLLAGIVAIVGAYAVNVRLWQQIKIYPRTVKQYLWIGVALIPLLLIVMILFSMFIYTYKSFNQFYPQVVQEIKAEGSVFNKWNIDGYQFMKDTHSADYKAIMFIEKEISSKKDIIILEAVKGQSSYTYFARMASYTGVPTLLGWPFHIVQWHGDYKTDIADVVQIEKDVTTMYTNRDNVLIKKMLKQYQVEYVYIGEQEHLLYENELNKTINLSFYQKNCTLIYEDKLNSSSKKDNTYLFKCPNL